MRGMCNPFIPLIKISMFLVPLPCLKIWPVTFTILKVRLITVEILVISIVFKSLIVRMAGKNNFGRLSEWDYLQTKLFRIWLQKHSLYHLNLVKPDFLLIKGLSSDLASWVWSKRVLSRYILFNCLIRSSKFIGTYSNSLSRRRLWDVLFILLYCGWCWHT